MSLREVCPPTVVAAARHLRTVMTLSGIIDPAERRHRLQATAALRSLPVGPPNGQRVLIFSLRGGWYPHTAWESVIAHALRLRGADVHVLNCGGRMPICEVNFRHASPRVACAECRLYPSALNAELGLTPSWLRDYVTPADLAEIEAAVGATAPAAYESWHFDGRPIGALVRNSVLWFVRKSRVDLKADAAVYRDFLIAGAQIARMAPRLIAAARPDVILELNGLFFAEQILNTFVTGRCRVITYEAGWRTNSLGFDLLSDLGFADIGVPWDAVKDVALTPAQAATLDEWMNKRRGGDMQRDFYVRFESPTGGLVASLGLDPRLPTAVLFTNLVWDTAVFGRDVGFESIAAWLRLSVEWFRDHPDRQLVIRIHPAEDLRPSQESREKLSDLVRTLALPANVVCVPSKSSVSSYALMDAASAVMVYTSTAGLEAALYGKRVLVGARVYYGNRGFTVDLDHANALGPALEGAFANPTLSDTELDLARRFAYLLLFRFLHDVPVVKQRPHTWPLLALEEVPLVQAGHHQDFDALLGSILWGGPLARTAQEHRTP